MNAMKFRSFYSTAIRARDPFAAGIRAAFLATVFLLVPAGFESVEARQPIVSARIQSKPIMVNGREDGHKLIQVMAVIRVRNLKGGTNPTSGVRQWVRRHGCDRTATYRGDDAGHAIAKVLGGRGGMSARNIFPQHLSMNRGVFRAWEHQIRKALKEKDTKHVLVLIRFTYGDPVKKHRPTKVEYTYRVRKTNGSQVTRRMSFTNLKPPSC